MLLLRTALMAALVAALARPVLKRGALSGRRNGLAVVVLDVSYSMGLPGPGGRPLLETAREHALAVLNALGDGDAVAIVTAGVAPDVALAPETDRGKAADEIRRIELSDGATDLAAAANAAADIMDATPAATRTACLITDLQANSWKPPRGEKALADALARLTRSAKTTVIDVNRRAEGGRLSVRNAAVVSLAAADELVVEGMPAVFRAEIAANGIEPERLAAAWEVAGAHQEPPRPLEPSAQGGGLLAAEWKYSFRKAGTYRVAARVTEGGRAAGIPADDERLLAVTVRESVNVLIVQGGRTDLDPFQREADFLMLALQPGDDLADRRLSVASRKVLPESEMAAARLSQYDVVILANVGAVAPEIAVKLESFVRQGGGLLVFLGDQVDADAYNLQLYKDGAGLLPAQVLRERGPAAAGGAPAGEAQPVGLDPLSHPVMASLRGGDYGQPKDAAVRAYAKVGEAARVVCRYTDGGTAVAEKRFGRGGVVLVTTACDRDWSDLPVQPLYAPFIQDMVRYLVQQPRLGVTVGEKWTKPLTPSELGHVVTVTAPDGKVHTLQPEVKGGDAVATHERTERKGFYHVEIGDTRYSFAANVDPEEGAVERLDDAAIRRLFPKFEHAYLDGSRDIRRGMRDLMAGRDLGKGLVYLALCLACVEVVLTHVFHRGRSA
jgi:hypothetical protein